MGLDWIAGAKAKPGHEKEFAELVAKEEQTELTDEMQERYNELSIAPYESVGAPIVGQDPIADAWVLWQVRHQHAHEHDHDHDHADGAEHDHDHEHDDDEPACEHHMEEVDLESVEARTPQNDEERQALDDMAGYHVLELAPPCDGLPYYTHGNMYDGVDLTSFRGKFLEACTDVIGEELLERAWNEQSAEELDAYGAELIEKARQYARANNCADVESREDAPEDHDSPAGLAHIVFAAGRWCRHWGSRGFSLQPWF